MTKEENPSGAPTSGVFDAMASTTATAATAVAQGGQQFPEKVFHMIEHCHVNRPQIAQWDLSEGGFKVYDVDALIRDVFPSWEFINPSTGHSISFSSFQRQLNGYCFTVRIDSKSPTTRVIRHRQDLFKRNHLDQVRLIQKRGATNSPATTIGDASTVVAVARTATSSPAASTSSSRSSFSSSSSSSSSSSVAHPASSISRHHVSTASTGSETASNYAETGWNEQGNVSPSELEDGDSPANAAGDQRPRCVDRNTFIVRTQRLSNLVVKGTNMVLKRLGAADKNELLSEEDGADHFEEDEADHFEEDDEKMEKLFLNGGSFFGMEDDDDARQPLPVGGGLPTLQEEEDEENDEVAPANFRIGGAGVTAEMHRFVQATWHSMGGGGSGADSRGHLPSQQTHQLVHSPPPLSHPFGTLVSPGDSPGVGSHQYMDFSNVAQLPHSTGGNKRANATTSFDQNGNMQSSSHKQRRTGKNADATKSTVFSTNRQAANVGNDVKPGMTRSHDVLPGVERVVYSQVGVEQSKKAGRSSKREPRQSRKKVVTVNLCGPDVKPFDDKDGDSSWIMSSSTIPGMTHNQRNLMIRIAFFVGVLMVILQINILILLWYTRRP